MSRAGAAKVCYLANWCAAAFSAEKKVMPVLQMRGHRCCIPMPKEMSILGVVCVTCVPGDGVARPLVWPVVRGAAPPCRSPCPRPLRRRRTTPQRNHIDTTRRTRSLACAWARPACRPACLHACVCVPPPLPPPLARALSLPRSSTRSHALRTCVHLCCHHRI